MEYNTEMEEVLELWQNVSKDPNYISKDMEISIERVHEILEELSSRGDILDYEVKILKLDEMYLDDKTRREVGIINIESYKSLDDVYYCDGFTIFMVAMNIYKDVVLIFMLVSTKLNKNLLGMRMAYRNNDIVYFQPFLEGEEEDFKLLERNLKTLGKYNEFKEKTEEIVNDLLPIDFWKIKQKNLN